MKVLLVFLRLGLPFLAVLIIFMHGRFAVTAKTKRDAYSNVPLRAVVPLRLWTVPTGPGLHVRFVP